MKILITMGGAGSRFRKIGINKPKHEIIAGGKTLFEWSLISLKDFFDEEFVFIARKDNYDVNFIINMMEKLGITKFQIVEVDYLTEGQASTTMIADSVLNDNDEILIYNIDTYITEGVIKKEDIKDYMDGLIPSFDAQGDKWSFVKFDENMKVEKITEKVRISNYGTVGLYYFKSWQKFKEIYLKYKMEIIKEYKETYIAPMYQYMIEENQGVYASIIKENDLFVLGTPEDIEEFDSNYLKSN